MGAPWFRLESVEGWSPFANYSLISTIASFVLITISVIFIKSRYRGLLEKFGVTPFQPFYFMLGFGFSNKLVWTICKSFSLIFHFQLQATDISNLKLDLNKLSVVV